MPPIPAREPLPSPIHAPIPMLPSPADSQKSALTSWYDAWFETQSTIDYQEDFEQTQTQPPEPNEPRSFFEDDSDDEPEEMAHDASDSDYSSILPDCSSDSDSNSDSEQDPDADGNGEEDEDEDEDATVTVGSRVTWRRASCHVFSASSSEDSHTERDSRDSTPRNRRAFELDRSTAIPC